MKIIDIRFTQRQEVIEQAVKVLKNGGLVIYPTETTYGIGVDATNQAAVDKLLQYKKRREGKPLSIAVTGIEMAKEYVFVNEKAETIYKTFLPGPVTVVSVGKHMVSHGVESELGTLGIRIPAYSLVTDIVSSLGKPITATGANASYKKRPYSMHDILDNTSEKQQNLIDLILDVGELSHNDPSTVVDTTLDEVSVLRQGDIRFTESQVETTQNEEETIAFGKKLIHKYKNVLSYKSIIICLEGEMGAGKTQVCKGIALGLGVTHPIVSPTFTLLRNYPFEGEGKKLEFVHVDTWRLFDPQELEQLGLHDFIDNCNVIAIEWADKIVDVLKKYADEAKIVWVKLEYGEKENERKISYSDTSFSS